MWLYIDLYHVLYGLLPQKNYEEMIKNYKLLLTYIKSAVTRNYSEKSINGILDYISTSEKVRNSMNYSILYLYISLINNS